MSMLMLHGPGTPPKPQAAAPDPDIESDDDADARDADRFEDALFGLLAHLEHLREGLVAAEAPRVGPLMDLVTAFAEQSCPLGPGPEGSEAQARLAEFHAARQAIHDPAHEPGAARRCYAALYDAVFAHFVVFTSRFPTSRAARGWVEVAATFVTELKRTLREPDGPPQP